MKRPKNEMQESYSEGNLDEGTIAYFLRHLDNFDAPKPVRHKMKLALVELVSNILVHANGGYGSVAIKHEGDNYVIKTSNYSPIEKITNTIALAQAIRNSGDPRKQYFEQLSEVSYEKQVSLGLFEIFRLSEGQVTISSSTIDDAPVIHFEIKLRDGKDPHTVNLTPHTPL